MAELPEFVTMNRMYRKRDFELITISADSPEEKDKALEVLKQKQVAAKNYLFDANDKYKLMEAVDEKASGAVPHTILIAPEGRSSIAAPQARAIRWTSKRRSPTTWGEPTSRTCNRSRPGKQPARAVCGPPRYSAARRSSVYGSYCD